MKSTRPQGGYTIFEVMIVLAVTGGLLISAMTLISGQQSRTEFTTSARDFENKLQDIFNDVETGYYGSNGQLKCENPSYNGPSITGAASSLGTNEGCIFLGKAMRFFRAADGVTNYEIYTIAGKRQWLNGTQPENVTQLDQANPKLFYNLPHNSPYDSGSLDNGLTISEIKFVTSYSLPTTYASTVEGLAILSGIGAKDSLGKDIAAADNRAYLASVNLTPGSPPLSHSFADFRAKIDSNPPDITPYTQGLVICLNNGSNGRVAAIGIGVQLDAANNPQPSGNRLATDMFLDDNASKFGCTS